MRSTALCVVALSGHGTSQVHYGCPCFALQNWSDIQDMGFEKKKLHSGCIAIKTEPHPGLCRVPLRKRGRCESGHPRLPPWLTWLG